MQCVILVKIVKTAIYHVNKLFSTGGDGRSCCHCSAEFYYHGDPSCAGSTDTAVAKQRWSEEKTPRYVVVDTVQHMLCVGVHLLSKHNLV